MINQVFNILFGQDTASEAEDDQFMTKTSNLNKPDIELPMIEEVEPPKRKRGRPPKNPPSEYILSKQPPSNETKTPTKNDTHNASKTAKRKRNNNNSSIGNDDDDYTSINSGNDDNTCKTRTAPSTAQKIKARTNSAVGLATPAFSRQTSTASNASLSMRRSSTRRSKAVDMTRPLIVLRPGDDPVTMLNLDPTEAEEFAVMLANNMESGYYSDNEDGALHGITASSSRALRELATYGPASYNNNISSGGAHYGESTTTKSVVQQHSEGTTTAAAVEVYTPGVYERVTVQDILLQMKKRDLQLKSAQPGASNHGTANSSSSGGKGSTMDVLHPTNIPSVESNSDGKSARKKLASAAVATAEAAVSTVVASDGRTAPLWPADTVSHTESTFNVSVSAGGGGVDTTIFTAGAGATATAESTQQEQQKQQDETFLATVILSRKSNGYYRDRPPVVIPTGRGGQVGVGTGKYTRASQRNTNSALSTLTETRQLNNSGVRSVDQSYTDYDADSDDEEFVATQLQQRASADLAETQASVLTAPDVTSASTADSQNALSISLRCFEIMISHLEKELELSKRLVKSTSRSHSQSGSALAMIRPDSALDMYHTLQNMLSRESQYTVRYANKYITAVDTQRNNTTAAGDIVASDNGDVTVKPTACVGSEVRTELTYSATEASVTIAVDDSDTIASGAGDCNTVTAIAPAPAAPMVDVVDNGDVEKSQDRASRKSRCKYLRRIISQYEQEISTGEALHAHIRSAHHSSGGSISAGGGGGSGNVGSMHKNIVLNRFKSEGGVSNVTTPLVAMDGQDPLLKATITVKQEQEQENITSNDAHRENTGKVEEEDVESRTSSIVCNHNRSRTNSSIIDETETGGESAVFSGTETNSTESAGVVTGGDVNQDSMQQQQQQQQQAEVEHKRACLSGDTQANDHNNIHDTSEIPPPLPLTTTVSDDSYYNNPVDSLQGSHTQTKLSREETAEEKMHRKFPTRFRKKTSNTTSGVHPTSSSSLSTSLKKASSVNTKSSGGGGNNCSRKKDREETALDLTEHPFYTVEQLSLFVTESRAMALLQEIHNACNSSSGVKCVAGNSADTAVHSAALLYKKVYQYWLHKRSKTQTSLLRCYHVYMMDLWKQQDNLAVPITGDYSISTMRDAYKQLLTVRNDLDRVRLITDRVRRREKLKRELIRTSGELVEVQCHELAERRRLDAENEYRKVLKQQQKQQQKEAEAESAAMISGCTRTRSNSNSSSTSKGSTASNSKSGSGQGRGRGRPRKGSVSSGGEDAITTSGVVMETENCVETQQYQSTRSPSRFAPYTSASISSTSSLLAPLPSPTNSEEDRNSKSGGRIRSKTGTFVKMTPALRALAASGALTNASMQRVAAEGLTKGGGNNSHSYSAATAKGRASSAAVNTTTMFDRFSMYYPPPPPTTSHKKKVPIEQQPVPMDTESDVTTYSDDDDDVDSITTSSSEEEVFYNNSEDPYYRNRNNNHSDNDDRRRRDGTVESDISSDGGGGGGGGGASGGGCGRGYNRGNGGGGSLGGSAAAGSGRRRGRPRKNSTMSNTSATSVTETKTSVAASAAVPSAVVTSRTMRSTPIVEPVVPKVPPRSHKKGAAAAARAAAAAAAAALELPESNTVGGNRTSLPSPSPSLISFQNDLLSPPGSANDVTYFVDDSTQSSVSTSPKTTLSSKPVNRTESKKGVRKGKKLYGVALASAEKGRLKREAEEAARRAVNEAKRAAVAETAAAAKVETDAKVASVASEMEVDCETEKQAVATPVLPQTAVEEVNYISTATAIVECGKRKRSSSIDSAISPTELTGGNSRDVVAAAADVSDAQSLKGLRSSRSSNEATAPQVLEVDATAVDEGIEPPTKLARTEVVVVVPQTKPPTPIVAPALQPPPAPAPPLPPVVATVPEVTTVVSSAGSTMGNVARNLGRFVSNALGMSPPSAPTVTVVPPEDVIPHATADVFASKISSNTTSEIPNIGNHSASVNSASMSGMGSKACVKVGPPSAATTTVGSIVTVPVYHKANNCSASSDHSRAVGPSLDQLLQVAQLERQPQPHSQLLSLQAPPGQAQARSSLAQTHAPPVRRSTMPVDMLGTSTQHAFHTVPVAPATAVHSAGAHQGLPSSPQRSQTKVSGTSSSTSGTPNRYCPSGGGNGNRFVDNNISKNLYKNNGFRTENKSLSPGYGSGAGGLSGTHHQHQHQQAHQQHSHHSRVDSGSGGHTGLHRSGSSGSSNNNTHSGGGGASGGSGHGNCVITSGGSRLSAVSDCCLHNLAAIHDNRNNSNSSNNSDNHHRSQHTHRDGSHSSSSSGRKSYDHSSSSSNSSSGGNHHNSRRYGGV